MPGNGGDPETGDTFVITGGTGSYARAAGTVTPRPIRRGRRIVISLGPSLTGALATATGTLADRSSHHAAITAAGVIEQQRAEQDSNGARFVSATGSRCRR